MIAFKMFHSYKIYTSDLKTYVCANSVINSLTARVINRYTFYWFAFNPYHSVAGIYFDFTVNQFFTVSYGSASVAVPLFARGA